MLDAVDVPAQVGVDVDAAVGQIVVAEEDEEGQPTDCRLMHISRVGFGDFFLFTSIHIWKLFPAWIFRKQLTYLT